MIVDYIDEHRDRFGVEPICRVLTEHGCSVAPSTSYAAKSRLPSARRQRDLVMMPILLELWVANFRVYGARELWLAAVGPATTSAATRSLDRCVSWASWGSPAPAGLHQSARPDSGTAARPGQNGSSAQPNPTSCGSLI